MSAWIWVLSFSILGSTNEHGAIAKFQSKKECEQTLSQMKEEALKHKKKMVGTCHRILKAEKINT